MNLNFNVELQMISIYTYILNVKILLTWNDLVVCVILVTIGAHPLDFKHL